MHKIILAILTIFFSLSVMSAEKHLCGDNCFKVVRNKIDEEILKLPKNARLQAVRGVIASLLACASCARDSCLEIEYLVEVEKLISQECRNVTFFECLMRHFYFSSIISDIVEKIVQQIKDVNGSSIAKVCDDHQKIIDRRLSEQMNLFAYDKARMQYGEEIEISRMISRMKFGLADEEIHYKTIKSSVLDSLNMIYVSVPAHYIRVASKGKEDIFWSLSDGKKFLPAKKADQEEICFAHSYVDLHSHLIVFKRRSLENIKLIMDDLYEKREHNGIVIFTRPTFESHLCQQAFKKSRNKKEELVSLKKFVENNDSIQGFVKENALNLIESRLLVLNQ